MERITKEIQVEIVKDRAFYTFVNEINLWWPVNYTWSKDKLKDIKIDGKENGLCTEIGPFGFRCDWGRVTKLIENSQIDIKWQIGLNREPIFNPEKASDIEINFKDNGTSSTKVEFAHFNFENHEEAGKKYLEMMDSRQGWDYILNCYKNYCENLDR